MTDTPSNPIINQRYQVQRILGKGGMGITYEALDLTQNILVALKEISLQNLTSAKQLELLEREIEVLQQLNHPQIPTYLDYFEIETENNKYFYIVQELAQGKNLDQWVKDGWRVSETEVKNIAVQILQILDYLHSFNPPIIHRDLKPHNLIRSKEGKIYLVDFGAVQNAYYTTFLGGSTTIGTFGYMPLEQANGSAVPASDLYSLGATLLYLITHLSPEEFCQGLSFKIPANLNLSEEFKNWLETLLEPDVDDRFASAKEALNILQNPPTKREHKKRWIVGIGLVVATLSSLFVFNQYKWAILNHLGFPAPVEVCRNSFTGDQQTTLTLQYIESGGRFSESEVERCLRWSYSGIRYDSRKEKIVELLIKNRFDVNLKDIHGRKLLFAAVYDGTSEFIELLIKNGADVNVKDQGGRNLLFTAVSKRNSEIVEQLIKNGADVNVKDQGGRTPLFTAISHRKSEIAELLIKNGADVNVKDNNGQTPLDYAISHRNSEITELLIKNGAKDF